MASQVLFCENQWPGEENLDLEMCHGDIWIDTPEVVGSAAPAAFGLAEVAHPSLTSVMLESASGAVTQPPRPLRQ